MTIDDIDPKHTSAPDTPTPADVSKAAEADQAKGQADAFPPEGTDEKTLKPANDEDEGLSQEDRLKATRMWLASECEKNRKK